MKKPRVLKTGGIPAYIAECPKEVQGKLKEVRAIIRSVVPGAVETLSYFGMPGYSCKGIDRYNGMFI